MATTHHPHSEAIWGYAIGTLDEASSVLVATHMALCPTCRREAAAMEATGGAMFEALAPDAGQARTVDERVLERVMARLDDDVPAKRTTPRPDPVTDPLFPRPLRDYLDEVPERRKWKKMADGVERIDVPMKSDGRRMRVLRIQPGTRVPHHGHGGEEMTLVLAGGYSDETGSFARGDVESADSTLVHQPIADPGDPCICLTVTRGPLLPTGLFRFIARLLPRLSA